VKRIDVLPDDVLLEIFDFYTNEYRSTSEKSSVERWQSLVHACRRWRSLVLASQRRLNLRLFCTPKTLSRDKLDIWPTIPLIVAGYVPLELAGWQLEKVLAALQDPFPELTAMGLRSYDNSHNTPVIPDSFLDGSAPRLQILTLNFVSFPGFSKLLLSATHLVHLCVDNIPHSGYISPEAMVAPLSVLSSLETFSLSFQSPQSRPDRESRRLPPSERSVIPALTYFDFQGAIEYLEDFVTRIDFPELDDMVINFLNQIDFDCPRLYPIH
jgi:F-box-like